MIIRSTLLECATENTISGNKDTISGRKDTISGNKDGNQFNIGGIRKLELEKESISAYLVSTFLLLANEIKLLYNFFQEGGLWCTHVYNAMYSNVFTTK